MSGHEQWGPWIEHDGEGVPEGVRGRYISVAYLSLKGDVYEDQGPMPAAVSDLSRPEVLSWCGGGWFTPSDYAMPIVRYRIRKPRALADLIGLAADTDAPAEIEQVPA